MPFCSSALLAAPLITAIVLAALGGRATGKEAGGGAYPEAARR